MIFIAMTIGAFALGVVFMSIFQGHYNDTYLKGSETEFSAVDFKDGIQGSAIAFKIGLLTLPAIATLLRIGRAIRNKRRSREDA